MVRLRNLRKGAKMKLKLNVVVKERCPYMDSMTMVGWDALTFSYDNWMEIPVETMAPIWDRETDIRPV